MLFPGHGRVTVNTQASKRTWRQGRRKEGWKRRKKGEKKSGRREGWREIQADKGQAEKCKGSGEVKWYEKREYNVNVTTIPFMQAHRYLDWLVLCRPDTS